jgi:hypothetical protein
MEWNATDYTYDIHSGIGPILQVGQETYVTAFNSTGSTISNGRVVYISGSNGTNPTVALAKADVEATSNATIGIATMDIPNGTVGLVTTQ